MIEIGVKIPKRLLFFKRNVRAGIIRGLAKAGIIVENEAKATSLFTDRTGNLRNSIITGKVDKEGLYIDIIAKMKYAKHLEYGTKYIGERPFMRTALKNKHTEVTRTILNEIKNSTRRR